MFDIGWSEMLVIAIVVIVVVGPKELPGMLRAFGKTTSKLRVMANDFRKQFDEAMKEAELDDLKKVADDVRSLNPANEMKKAFSPMEKAARDVRAGLDAAMKPTPSPAPPASSDVARPAEPVKAGATALPGEGATKKPAAAASRKPAAAASRKPAAKPAPKPVAKPAEAPGAVASGASRPVSAKKPAAARPKPAAAPKAAAASKPKVADKPGAAAKSKRGGAAS